MISIVVPCKNRPAALERLLATIYDQDYRNVEIIIIDDGSSPELEMPEADALLPQATIKLLRNSTSLGACQARNLGVRESCGEWILFLDDDTELSETTVLNRINDAFEKDLRIGVIALAELNPDGTWGFNLGCADSPLEVARFFGCGVAFRRSCFLEAGGFFEPLGYYYEEFELAMRVLNRGWKILFNPALKIVHFRDPIGRDRRKIARLIARNAFVTIFMRFPLVFIAPATVLQSARYLKVALMQRPLDLFGPFVVAYQAAKIVLNNLRFRMPVTSRTLMEYYRLSRKPRVWKA